MQCPKCNSTKTREVKSNSATRYSLSTWKCSACKATFDPTAHTTTPMYSGLARRYTFVDTAAAAVLADPMNDNESPYETVNIPGPQSTEDPYEAVAAELMKLKPKQAVPALSVDPYATVDIANTQQRFVTPEQVYEKLSADEQQRQLASDRVTQHLSQAASPYGTSSRAAGKRPKSTSDTPLAQAPQSGREITLATDLAVVLKTYKSCIQREAVALAALRIAEATREQECQLEAHRSVVASATVVTAEGSSLVGDALVREKANSQMMLEQARNMSALNRKEQRVFAQALTRRQQFLRTLSQRQDDAITPLQKQRILELLAYLTPIMEGKLPPVDSAGLAIKKCKLCDRETADALDPDVYDALCVNGMKINPNLARCDNPDHFTHRVCAQKHIFDNVYLKNGNSVSETQRWNQENFACGCTKPKCHFCEGTVAGGPVFNTAQEHGKNVILVGDFRRKFAFGGNITLRCSKPAHSFCIMARWAVTANGKGFMQADHADEYSQHRQAVVNLLNDANNFNGEVVVSSGLEEPVYESIQDRAVVPSVTAPTPEIYEMRTIDANRKQTVESLYSHVPGVRRSNAAQATGYSSLDPSRAERANAAPLYAVVSPADNTAQRGYSSVAQYFDRSDAAVASGGEATSAYTLPLSERFIINTQPGQYSVALPASQETCLNCRQVVTAVPGGYSCSCGVTKLSGMAPARKVAGARQRQASSKAYYFPKDTGTCDYHCGCWRCLPIPGLWNKERLREHYANRFDRYYEILACCFGSCFTFAPRTKKPFDDIEMLSLSQVPDSFSPNKVNKLDKWDVVVSFICGMGCYRWGYSKEVAIKWHNTHTEAQAMARKGCAEEMCGVLLIGGIAAGMVLGSGGGNGSSTEVTTIIVKQPTGKTTVITTPGLPTTNTPSSTTSTATTTALKTSTPITTTTITTSATTASGTTTTSQSPTTTTTTPVATTSTTTKTITQAGTTITTTASSTTTLGPTTTTQTTVTTQTPTTTSTVTIVNNSTVTAQGTTSGVTVTTTPNIPPATTTTAAPPTSTTIVTTTSTQSVATTPGPSTVTTTTTAVPTTVGTTTVTTVTITTPTTTKATTSTTTTVPLECRFCGSSACLEIPEICVDCARCG